MKIISKICQAIKKAFKPAGLAIAAGSALILAAPRCEGQSMGTYVTPRIYTIWSGVVTNSQTVTIPYTLTNFLNYSGYHTIGLWTSVAPANNVTNGLLANGTNASYTLTWNGGIGINNGYTNTVLGTNVVFSTNTTAAYTWFQLFTGTNAAVTFTNIPQQGGDSVLYLGNFVLTTTTTNISGFKFQLDGVLTP